MYLSSSHHLSLEYLSWFNWYKTQETISIFLSLSEISEGISKDVAQKYAQALGLNLTSGNDLVNLPEYLLGRLQFRKDKFPNDEFVFSSYEGQPIHMSNFRNRYFKKAILKVPFDIAVPYDLRHTFSAIMYSTGIDIWELSSMLGHENPSTTIKWYGNWFDKANHSAVDILDDWADKGITKFKSS